MHSNIFVITTSDDITKENIQDYTDSDIDLNEVSEYYEPEAADYVDDANLNEAIESFDDWFDVKSEKIDIEDNAIYKINKKAFIETIKQHEKNNTEEIKKLIDKPNPDLWRISDLAYPKTGYFFIIDSGGLYNEFDVEFYLEGREYFYIVRAFDYHY